MDLIKQFNTKLQQAATVNEDASGGAVGGGDVAAGAMPLFAQLIKNTHKAPKKPRIVTGSSSSRRANKASLGLAEAFKRLDEMDGMDDGDAKAPQQSFDASGVISKLKSLEAKDKADQRDTVTFGLEDENGGLVRVTVKHEQAEDFEHSLQAFMAAAEDEDDTIPEIAEVLFKLKDRFDIVDVQWPAIEQDEEQDVELTDGDADPNAEGEMDLGADGEMDMGAGEDTGQVTDLLTQVIDMMKADAEARKAEARAREAEAKTKEADAIVAQSMARVKREEQYLDMETYNKAKKEEEREAKRLAQLAKWKHDMAKDGGEDFSDEDSLSSPVRPNPSAAGVENEEHGLRRPAPVRAQPAARTPTVRGRVAPHDIAQFIIDRVK